MGKTKIEWTDQSWPIVNGCRRISPGCGGKAGVGGCYAERLISTRLQHLPKYEGLATFTENGPRWTGRSRLWTPDLDMPLRLKKPQRIFVADMGDLFFEEVTNEEIAAVFGVMAASPQHTFQVLTKRPKRMLEWFRWIASFEEGHGPPPVDVAETCAGNYIDLDQLGSALWPLPNVWLGVSVEDQQRANERIPHLLQTPAAVRFLSCEPLLESVDITKWLRRPIDPCNGCFSDGSLCPGHEYGSALNWVIVGGESGPGARPMHPAWARSLRDQCISTKTAFFHKQWGEFVPRTQTTLGCPKEWGTIDAKGTYWPHTTPWNGHDDDGSGEAYVYCVGKKAAGRLLDGREWDEMPAPSIEVTR